MRRVVLVSGLIVALVAAVFLAASPWRPGGPSTATPSVRLAPSPTRVAPSVAAAPEPALAGNVVVTDEPALYASAVASLVFGMDTRSVDAAAYRTSLLAEADPNLTETGLADLQRLVDDRIPADDEWERMRENAQRSVFVVSQTWEPGSWQQVVIAGQAEPGWSMRNVTGVQTTHYSEDGQQRESSRERTITIGMRCPASGAGVDRCWLVLLGATVVP
ncbi:hypothetical protein [Cellulomonas humilata]|uniref:Uncharacterized protein n=1 Tax=Cellulomonas humilata TaxID=144055 RepID=A0ABU0EKZ3_9CELL|nr:hypothetical protein [Cellulomonas humilata]MDQ0375956.1 hypothetical protein [Cellulomonas humilata]